MGCRFPSPRRATSRRPRTPRASATTGRCRRRRCWMSGSATFVTTIRTGRCRKCANFDPVAELGLVGAINGNRLSDHRRHVHRNGRRHVAANGGGRQHSRHEEAAAFGEPDARPQHPHLQVRVRVAKRPSSPDPQIRSPARTTTSMRSSRRFRRRNGQNLAAAALVCPTPVS